jgi:hypothetical protein
VHRWILVLAALCALVTVPGCGSDDSDDAGEQEEVSQTQTAEPEPKPIALTISQPDDGDSVRDNVVVIKGSVDPPDALVEVNGGGVRDEGGGRFSRRLRLEDIGTNDIEVTATAPGYEDAEENLDVTRRRTAEELAALRRARAERRAREAAERAQAEADYKASSVTIPYNQLEKNPERHKGTRVRYQGQIFQIQEEGYGGWMLLSVTNEGYGFWDDNIYVEYDGTIDSAEDDIVTVYGRVRGTFSYETQIGGETFVPHVRAKYIDE